MLARTGGTLNYCFGDEHRETGKRSKGTDGPRRQLGWLRKMPRFVIHEHHATRLHWDLRLEMDDVLKSWAIPKEPPAQLGIKRLAVPTVDHQLNYIGFEGVIPEGLYGAGTVRIWDSGTYDLEYRTPARIVFRLHGRKLRGRYVLIRAAWKGRKDWLFFRAS